MAVNGVSGVQQTGKQRVEREYSGGELVKESIFMDVNGDGKEDLYQITRYSFNYDGSKNVDVFIDRDGDGYNDYHKSTTYKNNQRVRESEVEEEDIESVKKRAHLEHEIHNRKMSVIGGDYLMMRSLDEPIHY